MFRNHSQTSDGGGKGREGEESEREREIHLPRDMTQARQCPACPSLSHCLPATLPVALSLSLSLLLQLLPHSTLATTAPGGTWHGNEEMEIQVRLLFSYHSLCLAHLFGAALQGAR